MDSLSQIALGAAVGIAVMGRRTTVGRAALWGAVCGTLPDLDVLIDHGDAVRNMTLHRAESHALFFLTLAAPPIAAAIATAHREWDRYRHWCLAVWLVLITHPLLDTMTVYGTQLLRPFTDYPFAVGSVFIIDPLYTLPLIVGIALALRGGARGLHGNRVGLVLSTLYLAWGVVAQHEVRSVAEHALHAQAPDVERILVTPTPFNSLLWRVVAVTPDHYFEGYRSLFDGDAPIRFVRFERRMDLYPPLRDTEPVARIAAFSHGFFTMSEAGGQVRIADLRMGQAPYFFFTFAVGRHEGERLQPAAVEAVGERAPVGAGLRWLRRRFFDATLLPPYPLGVS